MVRMAFTNTLSIRGNSLHLFVSLYFAYNVLSFAVAPHADKAYFVNLTFLVLLFFITALVVNLPLFSPDSSPERVWPKGSSHCPLGWLFWGCC